MGEVVDRTNSLTYKRQFVMGLRGEIVEWSFEDKEEIGGLVFEGMGEEIL